MLYVDDIQHTHPEFLQKFISLCDAQRKIEGVWKGQTKTYDMRGRKFAVVMAGNPYTESGEQFQIPDMLANRADVYNLGDVLSGRGDQFALSYIENSLTSNPVLQPLAGRSMDDVYMLVRKAQGEEIAASDLKYGYSAVEVQEIVSVLQKLFAVQDVLLKVNQQYIQSAAQADEYRTEPRFQLQGSYRNMNKMAEKVVSAMNEEELERLIDDHYRGESQTLTTGAETNLLKLAEMRGTMTPEQEARWKQVKSEYGRRKMMGGDEDDPIVRVTGTLAGLAQKLDAIRESVASAATSSAKQRAEEHSAQTKRLAAEAEERTAMASLSTKQQEEIAALLSKLDAAIAKLSAPKLDVQVRAELGDETEQILGQQVALFERVLRPLVEASSNHLEDGRALSMQLVNVLEEFRKQLGGS